MTTPTMTTAMPSGIAVLLGRIGRSASNAHLAVRAWNDRRVTRNLLRGLTTRELDDIGLMRSDIDDLA